METVEHEPSKRRVPRVAWLVAATVAVAVAVGAWVLTAPDDVVTPGGILGEPIELGGSSYLGYYYLSDRDLVIESIDPVTLNGLDVALWSCDPAQNAWGTLGQGTRDDLAEYCRSVDPFVPGTVIAGRNPDSSPTEPYLLVEVAPTSDQPQGLCALDITYRRVDGWRTGRQRDGGLYRVAVNEDVDPHGPDDELLSACES